MVGKVAAIISLKQSLKALQECLIALSNQSYSIDHIIVVDSSGQEEETKQILAKYEKWNTAVISRRWIGQADVFAHGMEHACTDGVEFVWLLRENSIPEKNALEKIMDLEDKMHGEYGFLSSVVLFHQELYQKSAPDIRDLVVWNHYKAIGSKACPLAFAAFEGLFLPCYNIKQAGLPCREMKQGYDGYEYTQRLGKIACGYYVLESEISHASTQNTSYAIEKAKDGDIRKYHSVYCNDMYISRKEGIRRLCFCLFRAIRDMKRVFQYAETRKAKRIVQIISGICKGLIWTPEITYIESEKYESDISNHSNL